MHDDTLIGAQRHPADFRQDAHAQARLRSERLDGEGGH
jgi:hypothetical protein